MTQGLSWGIPPLVSSALMISVKGKNKIKVHLAIKIQKVEAEL